MVALTMEIRSDEELLRGHLRGEATAFAELVERYASELLRFLMRFLGRRALAEDVVQETFMQVHVSAAGFDPHRRVKPWLFTIAANKARDALRSRVRRREVQADTFAPARDEGRGVLEVLPDDASGPMDAAEQSEEAARVREVVNSLPDPLREVLILAYFHQFPYREIAEILGVPIGTVKSRLHAAVAQFGNAYRREEQ